MTKGIANGTLGAPATGKCLADPMRTLGGVEHPGARLPRGLVAQVLGVAAGQFDHPVAFLIQVKADDLTDGRLFVHGAFAIGRCLGYTSRFYILLQKVLPHADRRQQGCLHRLYPDQRRW